MTTTITWPGANELPQLPFRRLFTPLSRPVPPGATIVTAYTDGQVTLRTNRTKIGYHEAADLSGFQGVAKGDFVVHGLDIMRGSVGISDADGAISAVCIVCRPADVIEPRYAAYAVRLQAASGYPKALARGVREGGADFRRWSTLAELPIPVPPRPQQQAIADYLDRETAEIDVLIAKQDQLIATLRERRLSVVTSLATGRTKADLTIADNPYIGSVPRGWTVTRFGRATEVNGGQVDPRDEPWASMVLIAPSHIESGTGRILNRETAGEQGADSGKPLASKGQIIYSKIRPALNKVALAPQDCLISADMYALSSTLGDDHEYLMYQMLSRPFVSFATMTSMRVKMPKVNREELAEAPLLRPPVDEQKRIVAEIKTQAARIDQLIAKAERFNSLAKERRFALITAAVTGQIDVGAAA